MSANSVMMSVNLLICHSCVPGLLMQFIAQCSLSFRLVETDLFKEFVEFLNPSRTNRRTSPSSSLSSSSSSLQVNILWGSEDSIAPLKMAEELSRELTHLGTHFHLVWFKTLGHWAMLEDPKLWSHTLLGTLFPSSSSSPSSSSVVFV